MDCTQFERQLVELTDAAPSPEREQRVRELQEHASSCRECAGCADLLQVLGRPSATEDPGSAYWEGFETRVRQRREASPVRTTTRWWMAAAAAVAVVFLLGTWAVRQSQQEPPPVVVVETTSPTPDQELPENLARLVEAASGDELVFVDELADWGLSSEAAGLFPDVSDLDGEAQQAFLQWLREQAS